MSEADAAQIFLMSIKFTASHDVIFLFLASKCGRRGSQTHELDRIWKTTVARLNVGVLNVRTLGARIDSDSP